MADATVEVAVVEEAASVSSDLSLSPVVTSARIRTNGLLIISLNPLPPVQVVTLLKRLPICSVSFELEV